MGVDWKCTVCQRNIYSTQMLQTRIFIFHQRQYNHGTVFRAIHHDSRKGGGAKWQWNEGGRTWVCGGENDKDRKNELGKQERLRVQKQREERFHREQAATSGEKRGNRRRHGKSLSLEQSREPVLNAAAPRQRLVWGWHAAVPGYVGVTSAPGPGGLKTQGCLSREEGQIQAQTHCGNWADLAIWGPSDGEGLPRDAAALRARWEGRRNPPPPTP